MLLVRCNPVKQGSPPLWMTKGLALSLFPMRIVQTKVMPVHPLMLMCHLQVGSDAEQMREWESRLLKSRRPKRDLLYHRSRHFPQE